MANFILDFCETRGRTISHLSLQKVVYFCHVWSLIERGRPLIRHQFEAWQHGPVLQYLYREFHQYGDKPIRNRATRLDPKTGNREIVTHDIDDNTREFLAEIVDFYTRLRAGDLVELSHAKDGPWYNAWNHEGRVNPGMKIDNRLIVSYYSQVRPPFTLQ